MKHYLEAIEDWLILAALCAFAGFMAFINHTTLQEMTARKMFVTIFAGVFVGIVTFLMLDGMDLTYKQKIGRSVLAAYIAIPLLHGFYALAKMFEKNPEKWLNRK